LWSTGLTLDQAWLRLQSKVVSIHIAPVLETVHAGTFRHGDAEQESESLVHEVTIRRFKMGKYEVMFEEYDRFAIAAEWPLPSDQGWGRGKRTVINVSWDDAKTYAGWLSKQTGQLYRLPSESEWEYAARRGAKQQIWTGTSDEPQLEDYGVFYKNSKDHTVEVGSKQTNELKLYDLSGNVWEWVKDCWHGDYM
jgi:formylglycine-generating enzyme required for sulfatase activity